MKWRVPLAAILGGFLLAVPAVRFVLPAWIESRAIRGASEKGFHLERFPVRSVGLTGSRVGPARLSHDGQVMDWEAIEVTYNPASLLGGSLSRVHLRKPHLHLQLPSVPPPVHLDSEQAPAGLDGDGPTPREVAGGESADPQPDPPRTESAPPRPPESPVAAPPPLITRLVEGLPMREFLVSDGELDLGLPGTAALDMRWETGLSRADGRLDGTLTASSPVLTMDTAFQLDAGTQTAQAQVGMEFQTAALIDLAREAGLEEMTGMPFPDAVFTEPMEVNLLLTKTPEHAFRAGFEGMLDSGTLRFSETLPLILVDSLHVAGRVVDGRTRLEAGLRLGETRLAGHALQPFGIRAAFDSRTGMTLESESVSLAGDQWSGEFALKGRAGPGFPQQGESAGLECAFARLSGHGFKMEPASFGMEMKDHRLTLRATPLGIARNGLLWVEELEGSHDRATHGFDGRFTWYDTAGAHMGDVTVRDGILGDGLAFAFHLNRPGGQPFLSGNLARGEGTLSLEASGDLPGAWLNALNTWLDLAPGKLRAPDPSIEVDLEGPPHFLKGFLRVGFPGTGLRFSSGLVLDGIEGTADLRMHGLPATDGIQHLRIEKIDTGRVSLANLEAAWALPTFRNLQVGKLTAGIGPGRIRVEPFSFDPLDPQIDVVVHLEKVAGETFMRWLDEKRFRLEGSVSGQLVAGYRDGALYVAGGNLGMDTAATENRFIFADEAFLKRQFAQMGDIPEELRQRFLETLLARGIRITRLSVELVPLRETRAVSMRLELAGETRSDELVVPIKGLVINNVISEKDLGRLFGLMGPVRFIPRP